MSVLCLQCLCILKIPLLLAPLVVQSIVLPDQLIIAQLIQLVQMLQEAIRVKLIALLPGDAVNHYDPGFLTQLHIT